MGNDKKKEVGAVTTGAGDVAVVETIDDAWTIEGAAPPQRVGLPEELGVTVSDTVADTMSLARGGTTTVLGGGITDRVREAGTDASASDVLSVLAAEAEALPTGERAVVHSMTERLAADADSEVRQLQTWRYRNVFAEKDVTLKIGWEKAMRPSESTGLLVSQMRITRGERVLDIGTGTGVIAIAAHKLGAVDIVASDLHPEFAHEIQVNLRMNGLSTEQRSAIDTRFGDMFDPVRGEVFDHVIMNPPSIPCPRDRHLDVHYDSGVDGRDVIDRLLNEVMTVLKPGGRLTMVHGSLSDMPKTIRKLIALGFTDIELSDPEEFPFKDFYPVDHLRLLRATGGAAFRDTRLGEGLIEYFEERRVITARSPRSVR